MSDPIADILSGLQWMPSHLLSPKELSKQIRQLMADKACDAIPSHYMCASEILIDKQQAYELGLSDARSCVRKALEVSDGY